MAGILPFHKGLITFGNCTHILHHTNLFILSLVLKEFIHSLVKSFTSLGNILLYDTHDEVFALLSSLDRSTINQQFK